MPQNDCIANADERNDAFMEGRNDLSMHANEAESYRYTTEDDLIFESTLCYGDINSINRLLHAPDIAIHPVDPVTSPSLYGSKQTLLSQSHRSRESFVDLDVRMIPVTIAAVQVCVDRNGFVDTREDAEFFKSRAAMLDMTVSYLENPMQPVNMDSSVSLLYDPETDVKYFATTRHSIGICNHPFDPELRTQTKDILLKVPFARPSAPPFMRYCRHNVIADSALDIRDVEVQDGEKVSRKDSKGNNLKWIYGRDIITDDNLSNIAPIILESLQAYEVASSNFTYHVGLKVAIAVWNLRGGIDTVVQKFGWNQDKSERCIGSRDDINIHTGYITGVGKNHIETNYNAYPGCSGVAVISVDESYPKYRLNAIAIHAGSPKWLVGTNIAFRLRIS